MIEKLEIKNFKGLENVSYDKFGLVNAIYGKNETGKSSVLDCICWLLTDCTLLYGATSNNDELVNVNKPNELINASLVINGNKIERSYGHKLNDDDTITDVNYYYVNDRKCRSQKEYFEFVDLFLGLKFKTKEKINLKYALMNPFVLGKEIKQEVFRRLIREILDVDFDNIIFSKMEKYEKIKDDYKYQGCDINNLMTFYKQKIKKQNTFISDTVLKIKDELTSDLKGLKDHYNELLSEKAQLSLIGAFKPSNGLIDLINANAERNKELKDLTLKDMENSKPQVDQELVENIKNLKVAINTNIDEYNGYLDKQNRAKTILNTNTTLLNSVNETIKTLESLKVDKLVCPHCGKEIITEEQQKAMDNVKEKIEQANLDKKDYESKIKQANKEIDELEPKIKDMVGLIQMGKATLKEKNEELDKQQNAEFKLVKSEKTLKLEDEIEKVKKEIEETKQKEQEEYNNSLIENRNKLSSLEVEINKAQQEISDVEKNESLKEEKKAYLVEKAKYEALLTLAKDYANDLAKVVKEYCTKIFGDSVDFVMVKKNKSNDEQKPVCYAQVKGIPYNSLNSANNLLAGIIVIEKIKAYIGATDIPVLFDVVDNIGDATYQKILDNVSSQVFYTQVDREDKSDRTLMIVRE